MNSARFLLKALLSVAGLVIAGMVGLWLIKTLIGLIFYVAVGAVLLGAAVYLYGRAKGSLRPGSRRSIERW